VTVQPGRADHLGLVLWLFFALYLRWVFVKQRAEFERRSMRILGEVMTLTLIAGGVSLLVSMATGHAERNS
jgi:hypothetical protein